jgi:phosphatidylglycerophosphate synthase
MNWLTEYKKSLKNVEAEEALDIYFFRPIAFIIVKSLYRFPITPNQYSLFALISGAISSYFFTRGDTQSSVWGSLFFFLFAVLDCCDGMVARLKKNGTEFGRVIDGLVDYTVNMLVYFGLAYGSYKIGLLTNAKFLWIAVILAGVSKAIHSIFYDHYLNEYLSYEKGDNGFAIRELEELKARLEKAINDNASIFRVIALKIYSAYTQIQAGKDLKALVFDPKEYCLKNAMLLKLWSVIGPAGHILILILAYSFKMPNLLFIYAIGFANTWLLFMLAYQFKVNRELTLNKRAK